MIVKGREGILIGAGLTLIVLLVLQSFIGSGLLSTKTITSSTTVTEILTPTEDYDLVASAYTNHLLLLNEENASVLLSGYEANATVEWTGVTWNLGGTYVGSKNISILLTILARSFFNFSLSDESQTIGAKGAYWMVNSTFNFDGDPLYSTQYSSFYGKSNGMIAAQDSYVRIGNTWLIANETWDFMRFNCQCPPGGPF
jgi:hypothetical protein